MRRLSKQLHQSRYLRKPDDKIVDLKGLDKTCPVCKDENAGAEPKYDFGEFSIDRCLSCSSLYLSPLPTPEAISSIYNSHYYRDENQEHGYSDYAADEEFIKRSYRRRLLKISSLSLSNPPEPHIHEIGCALGFGLSEAQNIFPNAKVTGSDISTEAVTFARNLGFEAYLCDEKGSSSCFEHEGQADLVYLFDVIEHLPDIPAFKSWATEQLSDNGQMLITTPDMGSVINRLLGPRSPSIKIPQHIIYFDSATLSNALAPQFKLVDSWIDIQDVGIGMLLNRILHILRLKPINILEKLKFGIPVPNGIQLYLFEKC